MNYRQNLPLVIIGMPVFNGEKSILRAITSILGQSHKNLRLLIIDNCSTDRTEEIVQEVAKNDERLIYERNSSNIGMIENFNLVKDHAMALSPEYFTWASHDDYYSLNFIEKCLNVLSTDPSVVLVSGWCAAVLNGEELFVDKGVNLTDDSIFSRFQKYRLLVHRDGYIGGIFYGIYRVKSLNKIVDMKHMIGADHLPLAEMCILGKFKVLSEVLIFKTAGGASKNLDHLKKILKIKDFIGSNLPYLKREFEFQNILIKHQIPLLQKISLMLVSILIFIQFSVFRDNYRRYKHKLKEILIKSGIIKFKRLSVL